MKTMKMRITTKNTISRLLEFMINRNKLHHHRFYNLLVYRLKKNSLPEEEIPLVGCDSG